MRTAIVLFLTLLASACGQKGPLYLPNETEQTVTFEARDALEARSGAKDSLSNT